MTIGGPAPSAGDANRARFPALSRFLQGYLHPDFVEQYGSPIGAVRAFRADASEAERQRLDEESREFLTMTRGWSLREVRRALSDLGAGWVPARRAEVGAVLAPPRQ